MKCGIAARRADGRNEGADLLSVSAGKWANAATSFDMMQPADQLFASSSKLSLAQEAA